MRIVGHRVVHGSYGSDFQVDEDITFVCPCTGNETKSPVYKR